MPNIKSAKKRMRTSERRHDANRAARSRVLTARRRLEKAAMAGDETASEEALRTYASAVDKAAKRGAIAKNNASRRKARARAMVQRALA